MEISVIEKIHSTNDKNRKQREKMFISKFKVQSNEQNILKLIATLSLKLDFFFKSISFKYSKPNYEYPVHTIISQSDAGIVKISKYITVNSRGIAHWTRGVKIL